MANRKHTKDEMRNHFNRWVEISDQLPFDFVAKALKIDSRLSTNRIQNVAYGRTFDFAILEVLESIVKKERESFQKRQKVRISQ